MLGLLSHDFFLAGGTVHGILAPTVGLKHPWMGPTDLGMDFSEKDHKKKSGRNRYRPRDRASE